MRFFQKTALWNSRYLGYRVFKKKNPIERNDRFNIGTNTAAITAYIAARLVQAGKIKWTYPVARNLSRPQKKNPAGI